MMTEGRRFYKEKRNLVIKSALKEAKSFLERGPAKPGMQDNFFWTTDGPEAGQRARGLPPAVDKDQVTRVRPNRMTQDGLRLIGSKPLIPSSGKTGGLQKDVSWTHSR
jgi:hypothetical protein